MVWLSFLPLIVRFSHIFPCINFYCCCTMHERLFLSTMRVIQVILSVGMKLEAVITQMAVEITDRHAVVQGMPLVQVSDKHFWFSWPQLILYLIHYVLFQVYSYKLPFPQSKKVKKMFTVYILSSIIQLSNCFLLLLLDPLLCSERFRDYLFLLDMGKDLPFTYFYAR